MTRKFVGLAFALGLTSIPATAMAGKCDALTNQASSAQGDALVDAYRQLLQCSKDEAEVAYDQFMKAGGEVGTIVDLALVAIDGQAWTPVWAMMEKIPDYEARDEIARGVGTSCQDHARVVPFLKGAYLGLRDIQFGQWDDSLTTCDSKDLQTWITEVVEKPPNTSYNEKYNTMITAFVRRTKTGGLPSLQKAAIAAAENGPFNIILEKMDQAVQPEDFGAEVSEEDRKKLEIALVAVARSAGPEKAQLVADRLFNAGAESAAAGLLPSIYPDRVSGGMLRYGAAAIEACDKEAVVHWSEVTEPAKRWSIAADIEEPMRQAKPRLKCEAPEWPVVFTPEPVANDAEIEAFVQEIVNDWQQKGNDVKTRPEKPVVLP